MPAFLHWIHNHDHAVLVWSLIGKAANLAA
jgi:hypothetical protein